MTDRVQSDGNVGNAAVIDGSFIDVGLPESKLSGDLSELRGYLGGRLSL